MFGILNNIFAARLNYTSNFLKERCAAFLSN